MGIIVDKKKEILGDSAYTAWKRNKSKGTIQMATGTGKTFVSLRAIRDAPERSRILILYEETSRKEGFLKEIKKFNELYNLNITKGKTIIYWTYQKAYKLDSYFFDLVIADEIHDSLTPSYFDFYLNNAFDKIMGLSATIDRDKKYPNGYTKGSYLDSVAPVCFTYNIGQSQKDKVSRELAIYVIKHKLDNFNKNILAGNKSKKFKTTELKNYEFWNKRYEQLFYSEENDKREFLISRALSKRTKILYELPSKIKEVRSLISYLKGQVLVFGNSIEALNKVTINTVSNKNSNDKNKEIRKNFDDGKIKVMASFKKLKQGANINKLDNVILMSYYGKELDFIQRVGRLRKDGTKVGNVFIFVTENTQEEIWFKKMKSESLDNFIYCQNVEDYLLNHAKNRK